MTLRQRIWQLGALDRKRNWYLGASLIRDVRVSGLVKDMSTVGVSEGQRLFLNFLPLITDAPS